MNPSLGAVGPGGVERRVGEGRVWGHNGRPPRYCALMYARAASPTAAATPQHKHFNVSNLLSCRSEPLAQKILS